MKTLLENKEFAFYFDDTPGVDYEAFLCSKKNGQKLFLCKTLSLLSPVLDGEREALKLIGNQQEGRTLKLFFEGSRIHDAVLTISMEHDDVRCSMSFTNQSAGELNRLYILPEESGLNFYNLVNFECHYGTTHMWPEGNLCGKIDVSNYSGRPEVQHNPQPPMELFTKNETVLLCAPLELDKNFGFCFSSERYRLKEWYLDYGPAGSGETLQPGQKWQSPTFCFLKVETGKVYDAVDRYTQLLVDEGYIPDPKKKKRYPWHMENLYCTWGDQIAYAWWDVKNSSEGRDKKHAAYYLDEKMVRDAAEVILREKLPITTILIDDGWQQDIGEWYAHSERFPNLRGLIDDLHEMGFRVILWVNLGDIWEGAKVDPRFLLPNGYINQYGGPQYDYSNPLVQEEYLKPMIRRFISDAPGCYNADGIKTDFWAGKVQPQMPLYDPQWRGEANYTYRMTKIVMDEMRSIKPDACHIGIHCHPYLAQYMDVIRTYDVFSSNPYEHQARGELTEHLAPGCPSVLDLHNYVENMPLYFEVAQKYSCGIELGTVLSMIENFFTGDSPVPADAEYFDMLRKGLELTKEMPEKWRTDF